MQQQLTQIETTLARIAGLTQQLLSDPDGYLRRSVEELRAAFAMRGAIEPAVAKVRESLITLRTGNHSAARREFQRRAPDLDLLDDVLEQELLPDLRRIGFDL